MIDIFVCTSSKKRKGKKTFLGFKKEFAFRFDASINLISTAFAPISPSPLHYGFHVPQLEVELLTL